MAVDKSYGSGYKNIGMSKATVSKQKLAKAPKSVTPAKRKTATALLTKKRADLAIDRSPNRNTKAAPMIGELSKMLTGVGTDAKGKFSIDPVGLAFALPLGKVIKAASALSSAGKYERLAALESRIAAKIEGRTLSGNVNDVRMRNQSTSVFPRIDSTKIRTAPNRILEMQGRKRAAKYTDMDKFNDYMSGYPTSKAQAKSYGRAASKEIARNAKTPKMSQQAAQDSYERVSDLIKFGKRKAK